MGRFLFQKLCFAAVVVPAWLLVWYSSRGVELRRQIIRRIRPEYEVTFEMDTQVSGLLMYLEMGLVFGFVTPPLMLATCVTLATQGTVMHYLACNSVRIINDARPIPHYLWFSLALSYGLVIWTFHDNSLEGRYLVYTGVPAFSAFGAILTKQARVTLNTTWEDVQYVNGEQDASGLDDSTTRANKTEHLLREVDVPAGVPEE